MLLSAATERDEREPVTLPVTAVCESIRTSEGEGSRLLAHREEKGTVEAPMKKILIWRAEDLTPEGST